MGFYDENAKDNVKLTAFNFSISQLVERLTGTESEGRGFHF